MKKYKIKRKVKRVMICGSPAVIDGLQKKAASLNFTFSRFLLQAGLEYTPNKNEVTKGKDIKDLIRI